MRLHAEDGDAMGARLRETEMHGIQLHPKSFLCKYGKEMRKI